MRSQALVVCFSACLVFGTAATQGAERIHDLKPTASTVHRGFFDATLKPVLTIDSGDVVELWTATGNPRYFEALGVPKEKIPAELYRCVGGRARRGPGRPHARRSNLRYAAPRSGDTVEIKIRAIDLWLPIGAMSFRANRGSLPEDFPYSRDRVFFFDPAKKADRVRARRGRADQAVLGRHRGRAAAFDGPGTERPAERVRRQHGQSRPAARHEPVPAGARTGALISIGDGHAVQGDGEVGMSAVETSLQGEVQIILHKGMRTTWPRAETPTHYMTIGLDGTSIRLPRSRPARCSISSSRPRACRAMTC